MVYFNSELTQLTSHADVLWGSSRVSFLLVGEETRDEPQRTSAWEATTQPPLLLFISSKHVLSAHQTNSSN